MAHDQPDPERPRGVLRPRGRALLYAITYLPLAVALLSALAARW
ncbi:MAG: hypothetical protein RLY86_149 [Pseudomonadota bacterium]|jgi:hypothetical protein